MCRTFAPLLLALLTSCNAVGPGDGSLRVTNAGSLPIEELVVFSPGSEVSLGTVAPDATSGYRKMPGGVYPYAAFSFRYQGSTINQPVIDFVGEEPMNGRRFTYVLQLDTTGPWPRVAILSVVIDG